MAMGTRDPNIIVTVGGNSVGLQSSMNSGANAVKKFGAQSDTSLRAVASRAVAASAAVLSVGTAVQGLSKVVAVTREFNVLNAQLKTATGGAANAAKAFAAIQNLAAETPYDLQQVTDSFTKLVNLGLDPSRRALLSYGDTASAMGKDLNQLIEAVADAATGEFERLKEFGIKAKSEGDRVTFTFRGVKTTVKKEAGEIEQYLMRLGENNFAGAMAARMDTLDGAISNLGDGWDRLFLNISNAGIGEEITDQVRAAIGVLDEMNAWFESGQLDAYLSAVGTKFNSLAQDVATGAEYMRAVFGSEFSLISDIGGGAVDVLIDAFKNFPENVRAAIQLAAIEIAALVDYGREYGAAYLKVAKSYLVQLVEMYKLYGRAAADALNPFSSDDDLTTDFAKVTRMTHDAYNEAMALASRNIEVTKAARRESIVSIMEERDAALQSFDTQIKAADDLRVAYEKKMEAQRAADAANDPLAGFRTGATGGTEEGVAEDDKQQKALDRLKERYLQEQTLLNEHNEIMALIGDEWDASKFDTEQQWRDARLQAERDFYSELRGVADSGYSGIQGLIASKWGAITAETSGALKSILGTMATSSRSAFEISKAWALGDAAVSMYQGIAAGVRLGWPAGIPAVAWATAQGLSAISNIRNQKFGGAGGAAASGNGTPATAPNPIGVGGSADAGGAAGQQGMLVTFGYIDPKGIISGSHMIEVLQEAIDNGADFKLNQANIRAA